MTPKLKLFTLGLLMSGTISSVYSQDYLGIRTSRYLGTSSAIFNPANIADSRHAFSLNLVNLDLKLDNSVIDFDKNSLSNLNSFEKVTSLFNESNDPINAKLNVNIIGPGIMIKFNQKTSIAINTRVRGLLHIRDFDHKLLSHIQNQVDENTASNIHVSSPYSQSITGTLWGEAGLSVGRTLFSEGAHYAKIGATVKYLMPATNVYAQIDNFEADLTADLVNEEAYMRNSVGSVIAFESSGMNFSNVKVSDFLNTDNPALGFDIGLVYEYRPNHERYRNHETGLYDRPGEKYFVRVGVALLDIGQIKFKRDAQNSAAFRTDISGAESLAMSELADVEVPGGIVSFMRNRPQYFVELGASNPNVYSVKLPTSLNVDVDVRLLDFLYVNAAVQKYMSTENERGQTLALSDNFTLTPRLEWKTFGLFLPINHNDFTKTTIGAALRFGGFFIGSSNIVSLMTSSSKSTNVYMGLALNFRSKT